MPLTTDGIAVQILSSIRAFRQYRTQCTTNDCKVVLNHLLRKFSEPLEREGAQHRKQSKAVLAGATDDTIVDHAVPVTVLVEHLLTLDETFLEPNTKNIAWLKQFLTGALVLVEITRAEDLTLSKSGFQRRMPDRWTIASGETLARYREAEIEV